MAAGHQVGIDGGTFDDRDDLRARHRSDESAPDGAGATDAVARTSERLKPSDHASARLLGEQSDEYRPELEIRLAHRHVGSGALEHRAAPRRSSGSGEGA